MERKATQAAVYEEFEPFCKWQRSEDKDILEINLQDFKKDQLKVQISNHGILKISGEREVDASKKSRFYKEVPASRQNFDTSAIQAKFINGWLNITLPKKKQVPEPSGAQTPDAETSKPDQPTQKQTEPEAPKSTDDQSKASAGVPPQPQEKIGGGGVVCGIRGRRRAMKLALTAAALAVLVAYVVYMYKATVGGGNDAGDSLV